MRNDVKLGFAIGGVLLAVLIVYVLVVPGGSGTNKQTRLDDKSTKAPLGGKVTLEPVPATQASAPPAAPAGEFTPGAAPKMASINPVPSDDIADKPSEPIADASGAAEKVVDPTPPAKSKDIDWNKLLNGQSLMTETPVPAKGGQVAQAPKVTPVADALEPKPTAPQAPIADPAPVSEAAPKYTVANPPPGVIADPSPEYFKQQNAPATRPSNGEVVATARTHRVASNETLSSIASAAYGNPNLWPAIVKANPNLDPNRMKVGQTINLPDLKDVKPSEPQNASAKIGPAAAPLDSKHYRVQSGDSLHKISVHLYGKSTLADSIYELNKSTIGEDPARLKVGQVLVLPETPTVTSAR